MSTNGRVPSIAVCVPHTEHVHAMFAYDLAKLMMTTTQQRPDWKLAQFFMSGSLIPKQRETLARECVKHHLTHCLFLDSDMRFPADTLLRLMAHDRPVVAANYTERRPPFRPVAFPNLEDSWQRTFTRDDSTGLEEVEAVGLGVALIDVSVFRNTPEPWFAVAWASGTKLYVGEDVWFCQHIRQHGGITVAIDHDLSKEVAHTGSFEFTYVHATDAEAQRAASPMKQLSLVEE